MRVPCSTDLHRKRLTREFIFDHTATLFIFIYVFIMFHFAHETVKLKSRYGRIASAYT